MRDIRNSTVLETRTRDDPVCIRRRRRNKKTGDVFTTYEVPIANIKFNAIDLLNLAKIKGDFCTFSSLKTYDLFWIDNYFFCKCSEDMALNYEIDEEVFISSETMVLPILRRYNNGN